MDVAQRNREMAAKDAEIERLTEAHKDCDYAIDNNYRAWQEAQAEIAALKASRDRLRRLVNALYEPKAKMGTIAIYRNGLLPGDLADTDPAPDAGQEVG